MHEMTPGAYVNGEVNLENINIYDPKSQSGYKKKNRNGISKTQSFPTESIFDNVAAGLKLNGVKDKKLIEQKVKESLENPVL